MENSFENFFKKLKVAIIGGTGGMGKIFVKNLKDLTNIMICSRSLEKAQSVAKSFGDNISSGMINDCNDSDIIIVSVPIENILENCEKIIKIMKPGSLLIDLSSVKNNLINKLEIPESIEYLSVHALFGPQGDFSGQNIILIPVKCKNWLPKIKSLFEKLGSNVSIISPNEHDLKMSKIQSLYHFIILSIVIAMSKSNIDPNFYTRSFKIIIPLLKNFQNNLEVIFEIQKNNPYSKKERDFFVKLINDIIKLDFNDFEKLVRSSFENLKL